MRGLDDQRSNPFRKGNWTPSAGVGHSALCEECSMISCERTKQANNGDKEQRRNKYRTKARQSKEKPNLAGAWIEPLRHGRDEGSRVARAMSDGAR